VVQFPEPSVGCDAVLCNSAWLHVNTTLVAVPIARINLGHQDNYHVMSSV
jgi:hypothetical protein